MVNSLNSILFALNNAKYVISLNISSSEFADVAAFQAAANDNFVDLFSRDPACQIILVHCSVSFCFYYIQAVL